MDPRQPSSDRPNTLGQAWRKMNQAPGRKVANLPPLPNWPPLPEERFRGDWPPSDAESEPLREATESDAADASYQAESGETPERQRTPRATWRQVDILGRWRRASKRTRLGIAAAAIVSILVIAACSSLALSVAGALGGSASAPLYGAASTQQTPRQSATSGSQATTTPNAASAPTSAATGAPTSAPTSTPRPTLAITFTCASGSLHGTGQVCVHTEPSAALSLTVRYCDGTTAKGLHGSAVANASGDYTWNWTVRATCAGPATASVTAIWKGQTTTATQSFTITA